ncbi:MAG: hypothetical protein FJW20_10400 [Acidimicrobiia bacterium]|nr:hypothetical protein [Acidimicrobiia bacterium]
MPHMFRAAAFVCALTPLSAQFGPAIGDWMTIGHDAQRSHWARNDGKISPEEMKKPGFGLVWKVKLKGEARQTSSVTPPALLDFYIGYRGFRTLGFSGSASGNITAIDTDLSRVEWEKNLGPVAAGAGTAACPGGMTANLARHTASGYPAAGIPRGQGRRTPAQSGVGQPNQGAVTLQQQQQRQFTPPPVAAAKPGRTAPPGSPFARLPQYVHAIGPDGKFHSLYASNGDEPNEAVDFLPAGAHARGLIVFGNVAYAATVNGCGGVPDGIWSLDIREKKVTSWKAPAGITGTAGFAAAPDGTLYVSSGSELFALEAGTLKQKSSYSAGAKFTTSPLVFEFKGKDVVAAGLEDGTVHLVDGAGLNLLGKSAASASGPASGALASWQEAGGQRWLLAPLKSEVAAMKVVERDGALAVEAGWSSPKMVSPRTPMVFHGVVFALDGGDGRNRAVLHAVDGASGKTMWMSKDAIAGQVTTGGLAGGGGRVYVGAHDGTQYAFGFPMEH